MHLTDISLDSCLAYSCVVAHSGKSLLGAVEAVKLAKARKFGFNKFAIFVTTKTER